MSGETMNSQKAWQVATTELVRALVVALFASVGTYWGVKAIASPGAQSLPPAIVERVAKLEALRQEDADHNGELRKDVRAMREELSDLNRFLRSRN